MRRAKIVTNLIQKIRPGFGRPYPLNPSFDFLDDLGDEEGEDKQADREEQFERHHFPEAHTSFTVPIKNVKIKVPTMMPRPVPKK
jgi:hypothetical protein